METSEVIKKNRKKFDQVLVLVKILLVMVFVMIVVIQRHTIINIIKWLFND